MEYFKTLPKIIYRDTNNISTRYTNLMARASILPNILNDVLVYYQYDIKDDDTPEIIAHKYYGDVNRFWMVLYCNQMMDPQWDWPLSSSKFIKYVDEKLGGTRDDVHHYEKIITTTTRTSNNDITTNIEKYQIDGEEFLDLLYSLPGGEAITNTYNLSNETISISIQPKAVTNWEYEYNQNESKRTIKLLNKDYAIKLEKEFASLMGTNG
jgi:hypothetical protein